MAMRRRACRRQGLCLILAAVGVQQADARLAAPAAGTTVAARQLPALSQVVGGSLQTLSAASNAFKDMAKSADHLQADALTELARTKATFDQRLIKQHNTTRSLELECQGVAQEIRNLQKDIEDSEHQATTLQKGNALFQKQLRGAQAALLAVTRHLPAAEAAQPAAPVGTVAAAVADAGSAEDAADDVADGQAAAPPAPAPAPPPPPPAAAPAVVGEEGGSPDEEDGASAAALAADDAGDEEDAAAGGGYGVLAFLETGMQAFGAEAVGSGAEAFEKRLEDLARQLSHAREMQLAAVAKMKRIFEAEFAKEKRQQETLRTELKKLRVARQGLLNKRRRAAAAVKGLKEQQAALKGIIKQVASNLGGN